MSMLYIADLKRDRLLKVGVAAWWRIERRESELRRELNAPRLGMFVTTNIPHGWGEDTLWERRLISRLRNGAGMLQVFAGAETSVELVESTQEQAVEELRFLQRETEIDQRLDADEIDPAKEDWRFCAFMLREYHVDCTRDGDDSAHYWKDPVTRQVFINSLRGDKRAPIPERLYVMHEFSGGGA